MGGTLALFNKLNKFLKINTIIYYLVVIIIIVDAVSFIHWFVLPIFPLLKLKNLTKEDKCTLCLIVFLSCIKHVCITNRLFQLI